MEPEEEARYFVFLGKAYATIHKYHGRVMEGLTLDEQRNKYLIKAEIPVREGASFVQELRNCTSGKANPTLAFGHYEVVQGNPNGEMIVDEFDRTSEYLYNRAFELAEEVRKRKGKNTTQQVVASAEKQSTLKKK